MSQPSRPLIQVLAEIPDPRQARGKRYPLAAVLALACAAMRCGYRSYSASAEWGRNYGAALLQALGCPRATAPCAATLSLIFRRLDCARLEAALGQWAEAALAAAPPASDAGEGLSLDGKTLRGSRKQGAPGAPLLSALSQRLGLTLAQTAVDEKTNEISAVHSVLEHVLLAGRVVTVDALLTQRAVAQTIVDHGGDDVMVAKDNQPHLRQDIAGLLATPAHVAAPLRSVQTLDKGHGRIERRHLTARALLPGACDWPGAQQVFRLERRVIRTKTGALHTEVLEGLTSRAAVAADPQQLLGFLREYWHIENKSHWVRDVTFDEDRSQVRTGAIPQVMAALRNTTIGLLRCAGATNIAAACRYYAAQPWAALTLLGIQPRTEN
jgi:predicted transposase YbfD/YdcC